MDGESSSQNFGGQRAHKCGWVDAEGEEKGVYALEDEEADLNEGGGSHEGGSDGGVQRGQGRGVRRKRSGVGGFDCNARPKDDPDGVKGPWKQWCGTSGAVEG